jgi:hypothetical protein
MTSLFSPSYWCVVIADKETDEVKGWANWVLVQRGPMEYWRNSRGLVDELQDRPEDSGKLVYCKDFEKNRVGVLLYNEDDSPARRLSKRNAKEMRRVIKVVKDMDVSQLVAPDEHEVMPPQQMTPSGWETSFEGNFTIYTPIEGPQKRFSPGNCIG